MKLPFRINSKVSKLKVEKVLNPPQKPITIKYLRKLEASILVENKVKATLRTKQLSTFAMRVPYGNPEGVAYTTPKRAKLPKPPPIKIAIRIFIFWFYLSGKFNEKGWGFVMFVN